MTGKSSGIVRCHYGVSSLAAMAASSLEVFEKPQQFMGDHASDIGFRQTGYVVGVGAPLARGEPDPAALRDRDP